MKTVRQRQIAILRRECVRLAAVAVGTRSFTVRSSAINTIRKNVALRRILANSI